MAKKSTLPPEQLTQLVLQLLSPGISGGEARTAYWGV
jgi:hypothetical protein